MQAEMTSVLGHAHECWRGAEGLYARLGLWGMFLGPEEQPGTAWKDWPDVETKDSGSSH